MEAIQFILFVLVGSYLLMCFASVMALLSKYKNYKETYLLLNSYKLVENNDKYITLASEEEINRFGFASNTGLYMRYLFTKEIYYDKKDGTIKLNHSYIFNNFMTYCDPYTLYWYYKLKKGFLRKGMSLAELREEKLNKLLR